MEDKFDPIKEITEAIERFGEPAPAHLDTNGKLSDGNREFEVRTKFQTVQMAEWMRLPHLAEQGRNKLRQLYPDQNELIDKLGEK